jgi:hypothetical protein
MLAISYRRHRSAFLKISDMYVAVFQDPDGNRLEFPGFRGQ